MQSQSPRDVPARAGRLGRRPALATAAVIALAGALALSPPVASAAAQTVRYGVVMDGPRAQLAARWSDDPHQLEQAYCITDYSVAAYHLSRTAATQQDDSVYRVFAVQPAAVRSAGPSSVDFECPHGVPELHTHTPSTCVGDNVKTCVAGGLNAFSCQPSREDLEKLVHRGDPFAVVQCDRRAFRFYYPADYAGSAAQRFATHRDSTRATNNIPQILLPPRKLEP